MPQYTLRFVSGKYQGGEFNLPSSGEVVFGRVAEAEIMLVEELVSRRHAKLTVRGDTLTLTDLGSTNGTFINGERIKSSLLRPGDRVLIGTSVVQLAAVTAGVPQPHGNENTVAGSPSRALLGRLRAEAPKKNDG